MSRKDKQADLRRRMAEARSKLLQSQNHPLLDDDEVNEEAAVDESVVGKKKRPLSPISAGGSGILRKPKYTNTNTKTDASVKQIRNSSSSHQNSATSLSALMDGYGESSSDDDDDRINKNVASTTAASIRTAPQPQLTKKEVRNYHHTNTPNNMESRSISKPSSTKDDSAVSDEVWDEFNAMLEADEAVNNAAPSTTTTTIKTSHEKLDSAVNNNEKTLTTNNDIQKEAKKVDLYDNDDINNMEQTSYEARLARLILLKNKKQKQHQRQIGLNSNEVEPSAITLPSAGDFYDPSLAWAEEDTEKQDGQVVLVEKRSSSGIHNPNNDEDGASSSQQQSTTTSLPSAAVSLAKILRGRRDEARMLASRGEDDANNEGAPDGKWF